MACKSTAEGAKLYRQINREKFRECNALIKRPKFATMKLDNSQQNAEQLFKERVYKGKYRAKLNAPVQQNDFCPTKLLFLKALRKYGHFERPKRHCQEVPIRKKTLLVAFAKKSSFLYYHN